MSNSKAFDIERLDVATHAEEGVEVAIINPKDKSDTEIRIKVLGVFAPRFKELLRQAKRRDETSKKGSSDNDEAEVAELLAEVTLGWANMFEAGKEVVFSAAEAKRIYSKYSLIRQQVFDAALDVANFVRG
jgi:hypothetical protein